MLPSAEDRTSLSCHAAPEAAGPEAAAPEMPEEPDGTEGTPGPKFPAEG